MKEPKSTKRQTVCSRWPLLGSGWTEFEVASVGHDNEILSRVGVRSPNDAPFVDISIEEYTGVSRRAKFSNARLEEEAARRLFDLLAAKFAEAPEAGHEPPAGGREATRPPTKGNQP
jgi:hypothetical protein